MSQQKDLITSTFGHLALSHQIDQSGAVDVFTRNLILKLDQWGDSTLEMLLEAASSQVGTNRQITIQRFIERIQATETPTGAKASSPFPGLRAFQETDAEIFFGRA